MGKKKLKVILDTNVLVSALLFEGRLSGLLSFLKRGAFVLLFSEETLKEFTKVLHYPKFSLTEEEIEYLLQLEILPYSKIVKTSFKFNKDICSDKDDLKFLELAVSVQADYVVSGDKDLLKLEEVRGIKILSPREFLALLEKV